MHIRRKQEYGICSSAERFFKNKDKGITVSCGCFLGTIAEFRAKVSDTHGNNKHAKIYNLAADMAELQIL